MVTRGGGATSPLEDSAQSTSSINGTAIGESNLRTFQVDEAGIKGSDIWTMPHHVDGSNKFTAEFRKVADYEAASVTPRSQVGGTSKGDSSGGADYVFHIDLTGSDGVV